MATHGNGIALVAARTETEWFQRFVFEAATALFFFSHRIKHYDLARKIHAPATFPSVLVAYSLDDMAKIKSADFKGYYVELQLGGHSG